MPVVVDFLNVGHGDCTVIRHASGRLTVIDINNAEDIDPTTTQELEQSLPLFKSSLKPFRKLYGDSEVTLLKEAGYGIELTNPIQFLKSKYPGEQVFRYIQTHPDMDHMRGLAALSGSVGIVNFWDTGNTKECTEFRSDADKVDWAEYQRLRAGPLGITVLRLLRDQTGAFFNEEPAGAGGGDGLRILAPTPALSAKANETKCSNLHSYILALDYAGTRFILGADADVDTWDSIVAQYGKGIHCLVLKASHHGRESGYHEEAVKLMKPQIVVVSVGKKPDTDAHNLYRKHCDKVWSTRWLGNIRLTINDDGRVTYDLQYGDRL